jgi:hypothetical protein
MTAAFTIQSVFKILGQTSRGSPSQKKKEKKILCKHVNICLRMSDFFECNLQFTCKNIYLNLLNPTGYEMHQHV